MKRVLLDCDGIIGDFVSAALRVINGLACSSYVHDDVVRWELEELLPEHDRQRFWDECSTDGFVRNLKPYPGAVEAVAKLREIADVYIVTAYMPTSRTWVNDRDLWLREHLDFKPDHIVHTKAKHVVAGDVLVDDKPGNVIAWQMANPLGKGLLWSRNYNRDADVAAQSRGLAARVHGWGDVFDALRGGA